MPRRRSSPRCTTSRAASRLVSHPASRILTIDGRVAGRRCCATIPAGRRTASCAGRLGFFVIARGGRHAIRVKDPESEARTGFRGLASYPVDPAYRVVGRLEPYAEPLPRQVATVIGTTADYLAPGLIRFELRGPVRAWNR